MNIHIMIIIYFSNKNKTVHDDKDKKTVLCYEKW